MHYIAGLAEAIDDLFDGVPELCTNGRNAQMVRSVLASLQREAKAAQEAHDAEWQCLKAERQAA